MSSPHPAGGWPKATARLPTRPRLHAQVFAGYFRGNSMLYTEKPVGRANFWATQGTLRKLQNKDNAPDYCSVEFADDTYCKADRKNGYGFFCYLDYTCTTPDFSEIQVKGEEQMFYVTSYNDLEVERAKCSATFKDACSNKTDAGVGGASPGQEADDRYEGDKVKSARPLEKEWLYEETAGDQCQCKRMQSYYAVGVEGMTINFAHEYIASARLPAHMRNASLVRTEVHSEGDMPDASGRYPARSCGGKSPCVFERYSTVSLPLADVLRLAGFDSLEDENALLKEAGYTPFAEGMYPSLRITGVEVTLSLQWARNENTNLDNETALHVFVKGRTDWHCLGSRLRYDPYSDVSTKGVITDRYHDSYPCGMRVRFQYGGEVAAFDMQLFVLNLTSSAVLLSISGTVIMLVAFNLLGYKSKLYKSSAENKSAVDSMHTRIATQALAASASFAALSKSGDGKITTEDLIEAFLMHGAPGTGTRAALEPTTPCHTAERRALAPSALTAPPSPCPLCPPRRPHDAGRRQAGRAHRAPRDQGRERRHWLQGVCHHARRFGRAGSPGDGG